MSAYFAYFCSALIIQVKEAMTLYYGKKVKLRELRPQDLPDIMEYVNDYDTYSTFTDSPSSSGKSITEPDVRCFPSF